MLKRDKLIPIIFILMLAAGMTLFFAMPKAKLSENENRSLAKAPKFSAENVFSGEYAKGIGEYLNDHFPFRDKLMAAGDGLRDLMVYRREGSVEVIANAVNDDMGEGENLNSLNSAPEEEEPEEEKLPEAAHVELADEAEYNSHGIIISNDRAMEIFGYYPQMLTNYAALVNSVKICLPYVNVYSLIVPTAAEFYSPVQYHSDMHSQKEAIRLLYAQMMPEVNKVDVYTYMAAAADQYIYYRTDHHWTARGAYQGYYAFCKAAGIEPLELESFPYEVISYDFVGSMYRYTKRKELKDYPDYVEVFYQPSVESSEAYYSADMTGQYDAKVISDVEGTSNKYLAFLGGDHPLMHIVTTNKNGRRLLVTKDSFGNALVPFLTNHYEEIFVVDPRSASLSLPQFCSDHMINDVIVENYAFAISNKAILDGIRNAAQ